MKRHPIGGQVAILAGEGQDGGMDAMKRWVARLGALFTTLTLSLLIPAAAWASTNGVATR